MPPEIHHRIRSAFLDNERSIWIQPPQNPVSARHLTLILDAELYRDRIAAPAIIAELTTQRQISDGWFVYVSHHSIEARWIECPCHPPFADFIGTELLHWLKTEFPALSAIQQTHLVGLSYTGLAAAFIAKEFPGVFQTVISQSGSFWSNNTWLAEQFLRDHTRLPTRFYLEVGTQETQTNVRHREDVIQVISQIDGVRRFRDALTSLGHEVHYSEYEGGHDFAAWKQTLPSALIWALAT